MIPLILIALGLGAALAVYELSPRTRSRVDAYVRAIQSANAAHQTADARLETANAGAVTAALHAQQAAMARQATPMPLPVQPVPPWEPMPQWASTPQPTSSPTPVQPTPISPAPTPIEPTPEPVPLQDFAEAQAEASQTATDVAVDHVAEAIEANQDAAKDTADAAKNAETEAQRQAVAQSAAKVLTRENKIDAALASLGVGQCDVGSYSRVSERVKNALLAKLRAEGMVVTGDNPWNIDTHQYGIRLRAVWNPKASVVKLIVTTGKGAKALGGLHRVTCEDIWKKIDPIMKEVIGG